MPRDLDLCRAEGVDIVFAPQVAEMYPPGSATTVEVAGLQDRWEGEVRPGHFRGVATIVAKLLRMVGPDRAYFGEKDYQQLQVVTRMAADLSLDAEIVPCPTVRDTDGLALSSRNVYLTSEERAHALALPRALQEAQHAVARGVLSGPYLCALMQASVQRGGGVELDYAAVVDPRSLEPVEGIRGEARALIAGRVGVARLIDNAPLRQS
jgi:pantoate--beta-alanine ligase